MKADATSRRRVVGQIAALAVLSGCSTSPSARVFTLSTMPGAKDEKVAKVIGVKPLDYPKYLDRAQLVRNSDPYELKTSEFERWGEGMGDMLTRVMVNDLADRLPSSHVLETSGPVTVTYDVMIEISISRLETAPSGVVLDAQWAIRPEGRTPILRSYVAKTDGGTAAPTALAAGISDALGTLSDHIAASIAEASS